MLVYIWPRLRTDHLLSSSHHCTFLLSCSSCCHGGCCWCVVAAADFAFCSPSALTPRRCGLFEDLTVMTMLRQLHNDDSDHTTMRPRTTPRHRRPHPDTDDHTPTTTTTPRQRHPNIDDHTTTTRTTLRQLRGPYDDDADDYEDRLR
ncbi:hypothetical protein BDZ89DRAFT_501152 [Hymenopellis radicata]|nr:hypothetical protein BDZ89DRAFT_501152 [Hymenopellis radicata]